MTSRRGLARAVAALAALWVAVAALAAAAATPPAQPNILLVIADDLSWDHHGFSGHPVVETPSLDALAAESIRFTRTYVSPTCRPSLATLLTGLYAHEHGITYIDGPWLSGVDTIADRLEEAGYRTYQAGKFWEGLATGQGFSANLRFTSLVGNLGIGRTTGLEPITSWVASVEDPWFVWFSPYMPHSPHDAPTSYVQQYAGRGLTEPEVQYFAMISWFDDVAGALIDALPDDTVVVYVSDNGYRQGETPGAQDGTSKGTSFEQGIRTELLLRIPGESASLHVELVHAVDVTATILALAGADASGMSGRSLLGSEPPRDHVFGSNWGTGIFGQGTDLIERWVVRDDGWKLIDHVLGFSRLFDLESDPDELENLLFDPASSAVRAELQELIDVAFVPEPAAASGCLAVLATLAALRRSRLRA